MFGLNKASNKNKTKISIEGVKGFFGFIKNEITQLIRGAFDFKNMKKNNLSLALKFLSRGNVKEAANRFRLMSWLWKRDLDNQYYLAYCYMLSGQPYRAYGILTMLYNFSVNFEDGKDISFTKQEAVEELMKVVEEKKVEEFKKDFFKSIQEQNRQAFQSTSIQEQENGVTE